MKYISIFI